jgi:hypothetical protein
MMAMRMMQWWSKGKLSRGQSLVETAFIAPLLLLMFIGVLEVGWALRNQVVLQNATREAARFAARGRYLDFSKTNVDQIGYPYVVQHELDSIAGQIPLSVAPGNANSTIIISHVLVDTGRCGGGTSDDLVLSPLTPGYGHFMAVFGLPQASRVDFNALVQQMRTENEQFNCDLQARNPDAIPSVNSVIIVESFFPHQLLVNIPFVSRFIADQNGVIWLYARTIMRITADARGQVASAGEGCEVYPIALHKSTLDGRQPGDPLGDIFNGAGNGNFGWMRWSPAPGNDSQTYLVEELRNPRLSINDFQDASDPTDRTLNAGDWIWGLTGVVNSNDVRDELQRLINNRTVMRIPVWDIAAGTGSNLSYRVQRFVKIQLTGFDLDRKTISATFVGEDPDACPDVPPPGGGLPVTIASDGFESGNVSGGTGWSSNWELSSNNAEITSQDDPRTGNYHLRFRGNAASATRTVNLSDVRGARLQFWWRARDFESADNAVVSVYDGSWHTVLTVTSAQADNAYHPADIDLSRFTMASDFRVRFQANIDSNNDYFYVDDVAITGYR